MSPIPSTSVDVAVVGAGPVGLVTACTLRKNGINAIMLDAAVSRSAGSRALVIHSRTLEVLDDLGITDEILHRGEVLTKWMISDKRDVLARLDFSTLKAKYPMVVTLSQAETEGVLIEKLHELGGTIYREAEVTGVTDTGDKVQLQVSLPASGARTTVTAAYVVAADGLRSTIREAVGIPFEGGEYPMGFVAADVRLSNTSDLRMDTVQFYMGSEGFVLFAPEPQGVWRIAATLDQAPKDVDIAVVQRLAERTLPGVVLSELVWASRFRIHHRLAAQYRKGRVFLAGDAAHAHSPAGGQGMNIGIQDGVLLGEVLSEALTAGKTSDGALDRYQADRRPKAKGVIAMTHRMTMAGTLKSPVLKKARNWFIWVVMSIPWARHWMTHRLSELE